MPRKRLAPGKITDTRRGEMLYATTYVRLPTRKLREREASSRKSAEDARRELKRRIAAELEAGEPIGVINRRTTLSELLETWIPAKIAEDRIGERTATLYREHMESARPAAARRAANRGAVDEPRYSHLKALPSSAAVYMRIILVGMYGLAARFDVVKHNPMRETKTAKTDRKPARLSLRWFEQVRQAVKVFCEHRGPGPRRGQMLPAFVELLAATGSAAGGCAGHQMCDVDLLGDRQRNRRRRRAGGRKAAASSGRTRGPRSWAHGHVAHVRRPGAHRLVRGDRTGRQPRIWRPSARVGSAKADVPRNVVSLHG